jgi:hypothetical protein
MIGSNEMNLGHAIPLSTSIAFGLFPIGYDREEFLSRIQSSDRYILNRSIGVGSRRVVIHHHIVKDEANLEEKILLARAENIYSAELARTSSKPLQDRIHSALQNIKK